MRSIRRTIVNLNLRLMFNFWHGYERLIEGLYEYYRNGGNEKIIIEMVGDGKELDAYKHLVKALHLDERVIFHGKLFGSDLDDVYNRTDVAFSSLGRYKNNIYLVGDLKTREYLAKGIPTVSGCTVDLFPKGSSCKYYMEIENNKKPVNIQMILEFYHSIKNNNSISTIATELHDYSLNTFDTRKTLVPVVSTMIDELKSK